MKKHMIFAALALAAFVSCQRAETPKVEANDGVSPVAMTLKASIGGADTKIAYVDEDNVLKSSWEQFDKVSVISLDISGNVLTNDVFTATSVSADGKLAEFEGEFSNHESAKSMYVYYPALTDGDGSDENPWRVPKVYENAVEGVLDGVKKGQTYLTFNDDVVQQSIADPTSHLEQYTVFSGKAEMEEGELLVELEHRSYLMKVQLTLPESGLTVNYLQIYVKSEDGTYDRHVTGSGWTAVYEVGSFPGGYNSYYSIKFGTDYVDSGTGLLLEGNTLTAYIVAYAGASYDFAKGETTDYYLTAGDYFSFELNTKANATGTYLWTLDKLTVPKDIVFENGKMYRVSATLEAAN